MNAIKYSPLCKIYSPAIYDGGPRTHDVDTVTMHCIVGQATTATCKTIFQQPRSDKASANYLISTTGELVCALSEDHKANTSSNSANDQRAITCECACDNTAPYAFNQAVWDMAVALTADIALRYGRHKVIWHDNPAHMKTYEPARDELKLTFHRYFAATECPGNWFYSRAGEFRDAVQAEINRQLAPAVTPPRVDTPSTWAVDDWEWAKALGITDGTNPRGTATREQVIAMIRRAMIKGTPDFCKD